MEWGDHISDTICQDIGTGTTHQNARTSVAICWTSLNMKVPLHGDGTNGPKGTFFSPPIAAFDSILSFVPLKTNLFLSSLHDIYINP